jgi:hypothetical protein
MIFLPNSRSTGGDGDHKLSLVSHQVRDNQSSSTWASGYLTQLSTQPSGALGVGNLNLKAVLRRAGEHVANLCRSSTTSSASILNTLSMSYHRPSISSLQSNERIGQGAISVKSLLVPQRYSSLSFYAYQFVSKHHPWNSLHATMTSIHILDNDSLLNIFLLY